MMTFLLIFGIFALFFLLMSTRIILKNEPEFRGTCASNNPTLKNELGECTVCGKKPSTECETA